MIDPVLLYVAVVTLAGAVPFGFYLGLRYAAARAELREPPAAHEALARVYTMPAPVRPWNTCNRCRCEVRDDDWGDFIRLLCRRCAPPDVRRPAPAGPDPSLTERVPRGPA